MKQQGYVILEFCFMLIKDLFYQYIQSLFIFVSYPIFINVYWYHEFITAILKYYILSSVLIKEFFLNFGVIILEFDFHCLRF